MTLLYTNDQLYNTVDYSYLGEPLGVTRVVQYIGKTVTKFYTIDLVKPVFEWIETTSATFTASDVIYNSMTVTYNDLSTYYGGVNPMGGPSFMGIIQNIRPQLEIVGEI